MEIERKRRREGRDREMVRKTERGDRKRREGERDEDMVRKTVKRGRCRENEGEKDGEMVRGTEERGSLREKNREDRENIERKGHGEGSGSSSSTRPQEHGGRRSSDMPQECCRKVEHENSRGWVNAETGMMSKPKHEHCFDLTNGAIVLYEFKRRKFWVIQDLISATQDCSGFIHTYNSMSSA